MDGGWVLGLRLIRLPPLPELLTKAGAGALNDRVGPNLVGRVREAPPPGRASSPVGSSQATTNYQSMTNTLVAWIYSTR